jgi:hypothetical protein
MAKFTHIANSFKSGQLGEKLVGRTDIAQYRHGLLTMKNMVNSPVGGAFRRGGLSLFKEVTSAVAARGAVPIPFVLTEGEAYLVVLEGRGPLGVNFNPTPRIYDTDGTAIVVERSVFDTQRKWPSDPRDIRWTQLGRYIFFCDAKGEAAPAFLFQKKNGTFIFNDVILPSQPSDPGTEETIPNGFRYPYSPNRDSNARFKYVRGATIADDTIQIVNLAGTPINYFTSGAGAVFRALYGSAEIMVKQGDFVSATTVKLVTSFTLGVRPADGAIALDWSRGQWDDELGWPRTVTAFQQRLVWGGSPSYPNTIWNSALARPFVMMQEKLFQDETSDTTGFNYFGELDSNQAFEFDIASSQATGITWLGSQRSLHVGTASMEFSLSSDTGGYSAIEFPSLRPQTYHGGRNIQPARIGRFSIFVDESGTTVRDFAYSEQNGSHISRDLSVLSPDIIYERLEDETYSDVSYKVMDWQESNRCLWASSSAGSLFSFSYEETADLAGWAWHEIGGNPFVWGVAVIPYQGKSTLFIVTQREIDGDDKIFIERLVPPVQDPKYLGGSQEVLYFDAGTYIKYLTPEDTHLCDLEGEEIFALADGEILGPFTVTAGEFTTPSEVTEISFGYKYQHLMTTMPLEAGTIIGSAQGQLKRVDRLYLDVYRGLGGKFSYGDTEYPIEYPQTPSFQSFTGRIKLDYDSTPSERYLVTIKGDDPLPFGLLNVTFRGVTQD